MYRITCRSGSLFDTQITAKHNDIGNAGTGISGDLFVNLQHLGQTLGLVAFPVFLGGQANTGTIGTTAHVRATESTGAVPGRCDQLVKGQAGFVNLLFNHFLDIVGLSLGNRILPDQIFGRRS